MELICIKHPKYKGKTPPVLACKACCKIFLSEVKKGQDPLGAPPQGGGLKEPPVARRWFEGNRL